MSKRKPPSKVWKMRSATTYDYKFPSKSEDRSLLSHDVSASMG